MDKKNKKTIGIIIFLIVGALILNHLGFLSFYISNANLICEGDVSPSPIICSASGYRIDRFDSITPDSKVLFNTKGEDYQFQIGYANGRDYINPLCNKLKSYTGIECVMPLGSWSWQTILQNYEGLVKDNLGDQLIVIEGTYEDLTDHTFTRNGQFKTYGFCHLNSCWIKEPDLEYSQDAGFTERKLTITNVKIYSRPEGYTENDNVCIEDEIEICEGEVLYRCVGIELINSGKVEGKCGYESERTYYRFKDNSCSEVSILPSQKTENDYDNLGECLTKVKIQEEDIVEESKTTPALYLLGFIIFLIALIIVYVKLKKKR